MPNRRSVRARILLAWSGSLALLAIAAIVIWNWPDAAGQPDPATQPAPPATASTAEATQTPALAQTPDATETPETGPSPDPDEAEATDATEAPWTPEPPSADERAGVLAHEVPERLGGDLVVQPGSEPAPHPDRTVMTVRIEMEWGLPMYLADFGDFVMDTLNDDRSWGGDGSLSFARTDGADPDIRVLVASPDTVDDLCAPLATKSRYSCGRYGHAALNAERWVDGAGPFEDAGGSITEYRHYMVNHEVGHLLGHQHRTCPAPGEPAPVMVQQTITLGGCEPNGWLR